MHAERYAKLGVSVAKLIFWVLKEARKARVLQTADKSSHRNRIIIIIYILDCVFSCSVLVVLFSLCTSIKNI